MTHSKNRIFRSNKCLLFDGTYLTGFSGNMKGLRDLLPDQSK